MPVRIYDISKKLGLDNKEVLSKAKSLNIAAARVASSSLDKITAEYLEQQLVLDHPNLAAPPAPAAPTVAPTPVEPISIVSAPAVEAQPAPQPETGTATATALLEPEPAPPELAPEPPPAEPEPVQATAPIFEPPPEVAPPPAPPPPPPPLPTGPKVGDKVGFIQLPTKAQAKPPEKPGAVKLPPRPMDQRRTEFIKRGDIRSFRGAPAPSGPAYPSARVPAQQKGQAPAKPAEPPKPVLPADAQVITLKTPIV